MADIDITENETSKVAKEKIPYNATFENTYGEQKEQQSYQLFGRRALDSTSYSKTGSYPINEAKIVELSFSGLVTEDNTHLGSTWQSWREYNRAQIRVSPKVLLFLESKKAGFSYKHEFEPAWDGLAEKGMLSKLEGVLEIARLAATKGNTTLPSRGKFLSKYKNVPAWKTTSPLSFSGDLKFEFQFGKFGLFDALEEVVKPILVLASQFTISMGENYAIGPAPTKPAYMAGMLKALAGTGQKMLTEIANSGVKTSGAGQPTVEARHRDEGTKQNLIQGATGTDYTAVEQEFGNRYYSITYKDGSGGETPGWYGTPRATSVETKGNWKGVSTTAFETVIIELTKFQEALYGAIDRGIEMGMGGIRTLHIKIGKLVTGPYVVGGVSWDFDFENTDSNGFPWKGSITLSDLQSIMFPTVSNTARVFSSDVPLTDYEEKDRYRQVTDGRNPIDDALYRSTEDDIDTDAGKQ
jgi:hypothetical protein